MVQRASKAGTVLLATFLLLSVLHIIDSVPLKSLRSGTLRLCSRNLSDALYLVCRERGYNSYSYSDDDETQVDNGPGLVDECCYHACSYEQLERYCKPIPGEKQDESRDVIDGTYISVRMPFMPKDPSKENLRSEMDYTDGTKKRKVNSMKKRRHRGKGGRKDAGECKGKAAAKKRHHGGHYRCRHRCLECRRTGKVSRGNVKPLDNKFVMSLAVDKSTSFSTIS
ncbi:insulin-like growth factor I isoform X1 [Harpegnathos saltator]|uniref:insulin-like growth factor I isoform X1 n=1 Tax=Harpegnathos saltator TaxID=610380 RepID=UPI00058B9E1B|nr:insulin-like growth factor I isoform X1 [Harpegnathos saltator]